MMNPKSLLAKAKLPISQLNKRTIIIIAALMLFVFLYAIFSALTSSSNSDNKSANFKIAQVQSPDVNSALSKLPSGYDASDKINNMLLNRTGNTIPPQVQALIQGLQSQQSQLQEQVARLQKSNTPEERSPVVNDMSREAATSGIFFSGGAPAAQPQQAANLKSNDNQGPNQATKFGLPSPYAAQNMQSDKLDFLSTKPSKEIYDNNALQYPVSQYIVQAGTVIPAVLQTKLVSDLPGTITAVVDQDVYDSINGQYLLIPRGTKLIGQYNSQVAYGQVRLQAKFDRLVRPDGSSIVLPNGTPGVDDMGVAGMKDEVDNHWGKLIGAATLATVFNIPALIAQQQNNNGSVSVNGNNITTGTGNSFGANAGTGALASIGQTSSQVGSQMTSQAMNLQPTITINAGYQFTVLVTKDMILAPFNTKS